jgi:8-amino-7-oxononanoate synthase
MENFIERELESLKRFGLYRELRVLDGPCEPVIQLNGRKVIQFSSNNYLGLATHPRVKQAAREAIAKFGTGAGASRLISGNFRIHEELEQALAKFKGTQAALVYATGSMANLGVFSCLVGSGDTVLLDEFDHATLYDGARLSRAEIKTFKHNDMQDLARVLEQSASSRRRMIVVDGVFSMDGDVAPLPEIVRLARKHDALTLIDEAHATGVMGRTGRGSLEHFGMAPDSVDIQIGTLSKALGSLGGYAACSKKMRELLINKSRPFIFTTALPPACAAAALAALKQIQKQPSLRQKLWKNRELLVSALKKSGLNILGTTPIVPVILGQPARVVKAQKELMDKGFNVPGIRPPTVPKGSSRLRISLMATHTEKQIMGLVEAFRASISL